MADGRAAALAAALARTAGARHAAVVIPDIRP
jgi:hypothetical protein